MILLKYLIRLYLYSFYFFQKFFKKGSFGPDKAVYITKKYETTTNLIKNGLFKHHVKQFHESSCSVATVASVVNTLLERQRSSIKPFITQQDLLEKVKTAHWKERMSDKGYKGKRGLPLNTLGEVVKASLKAYKIQYQSIEIVQAVNDPARSKTVKQKLRSRLEQFENKGDCIMIAHFDQGSFVQDLHIPHISPVGGFDPISKKITILDVDSLQNFPYQISFDTFYNGLSYTYNPVFRMFGYGEGGCIFITGCVSTRMFPMLTQENGL